MPKTVLLTGALGTVGTAITDHLSDRPEYEFILLDRKDAADCDVHVADVTSYDEVRPALDDVDAIVHLAGYPGTDGSFHEVLEQNIVGTYTVLDAAREAGVEQFVFASSNHAVGLYETEHAPAVYQPDYDLRVDHTAPHRPDSFYGASKCYGEDLGRYYVEQDESAPNRFYALRICSVRDERYDHPYGDAERGVDRGDWTRDSEPYASQVARMKAMWQSRRDLAQMVERCLQDESVDFDVFYGVSDNDRRWFDLEHARSVLGYDPMDNGEDWSTPP